MENEEYFSKTKQDYQDAVAYIMEHSAASVRALADKLNEILHGKVADFGNGGIIFYDSDKLESLLCVDITNAKTEVQEGNKSFIYGDFYEFNFSEGFDCVLTQYLLHHLPDDERLAIALRRLSQALGSRGKLVIVEMLMPRYLEVIQSIFGPLLNRALRMMKKPELRFFSLSSLSLLLKESGFDSLIVHRIGMTGWTAPAPVLFPKLKMPGWLYPLKAVVIEATTGG